MEIVLRCFNRLLCTVAFGLLLLLSATAMAQTTKAYTIKNGRMYIQLPKQIAKASLDSFITQFDLLDLDLGTYLRTGNHDSLARLGWKVEVSNEVGVVISKFLEPFKGLNKVNDRLFFKDRPSPSFPAVNNGVTFGVNNFRNKQPFLLVDSTVRFFLKNNIQASRVMLAGSFNNWAPDQLAMRKTDSGWIADVKLGPGKYWYKFIVNGNWIHDKDNHLSENDGLGNINSVYFRPNQVFMLPGFSGARKVFLAGSFNNWKPNGLLMRRTAAGWELPLYLAEGTHAYKFVADGEWLADPANRETVPDGHGNFNSVIRLGTPYIFRLTGFTEAREVVIAGSFNQWREFEWRMKKTTTGWELPYTLGPGNYTYKFKVDGKWIADPANQMTSPGTGNSYLVIKPNFTFRLKGFTMAKEVYLAGSFNSWDPKSFRMQKERDGWVFPVHLSTGKHLYKFIVDGEWIIDPGNKLWEQNEHHTGNSLIWIDK
jgi:hypothetical protein